VKGIIILLIKPVYWAIGEVWHWTEKNIIFDEARRKADEVGLPLVNYGCGGWFTYAIRHSDYNLDIIPRNVQNFILVEADTARLPFDDKSVVIYCSHVLEHTENPEHLMSEFERVSDYIYLVLPKPWFIQTWMNPDHKYVYLGWKWIRNPFFMRSGKRYLNPSLEQKASY